jgi:hypothetical protein
MLASLPAMTLAGGFDSGTAAASIDDIQPSLSTASSTSMSIQTTTTDNESYYDGFEDGNYDGWNPDSDSIVQISNDSFYGNYSLNTFEDGSSSVGVRWDGGPNFDTGDNFEISGTYKPVIPSSSSKETVSLGIQSDTTDDTAQIFHNHVDESTYLATHRNDPVPENSIDGTFHNTWVDFRLQVDGGMARLKVWGAGTDEPVEWQQEREFEEFQGTFWASAGNGGTDREIYVDHLDAGGNAISGQVVDQSGEPANFSASVAVHDDEPRIGEDQ